MAIFENQDDMIPEGEYQVSCADEVELSSDPACDNKAAVKLFLTVGGGEEDEGTEREWLGVIDPRVPARGGAKRTPRDFTMLTLAAFGADEADANEAIFAAAEERANGGDVSFTIPGLGSKVATVIVKHKRLDSGKWAENLNIRGGGATPKAMSDLLGALRGGGLGGGSGQSPFARPSAGR